MAGGRAVDGECRHGGGRDGRDSRAQRARQRYQPQHHSLEGASSLPWSSTPPGASERGLLPLHPRLHPLFSPSRGSCPTSIPSLVSSECVSSVGTSTARRVPGCKPKVMAHPSDPSSPLGSPHPISSIHRPCHPVPPFLSSKTPGRRPSTPETPYVCASERR